MSDEKIDLFAVGMAADLGLTKRGDVLALVRAVRAARAFDHAITSSLSSGFDLKAARLEKDSQNAVLEVVERFEKARSLQPQRPNSFESFLGCFLGCLMAAAVAVAVIVIIFVVLIKYG